MEKDLQFCHPRWPEEKKYIGAELEQIRSYHRTYFRDPWNIYEWVKCIYLSLKNFDILYRTEFHRTKVPEIWVAGEKKLSVKILSNIMLMYSDIFAPTVHICKITHMIFTGCIRSGSQSGHHAYINSGIWW